MNNLVYKVKTAACLTALLLFLPAHSHAYVIDRVAAVVNGRVITVSEVDRAVDVEALRRGVSGKEGLEKLREEALDTLIDRMLLLGEARRFNIVEVSGEEVEKAFEDVKAGFKSEDEFNKALSQEEMTVDELKADLRDQILAVKYVDKRVRFFVRVALDDMKKYYQENQDKFGGRSFGEAYDEIHALLLERETAKKLEEYLKDLRAKSEITIKQR